MADQPESDDPTGNEGAGSVSPSGNDLALEVAGGNEISLPNADSQVTSSQNGSQGSQLDYTFTGGDYRGASLGPHTTNTVIQAKKYEHSTIHEHHYHYDKEKEPSTSGMPPPKKRRVDEEGCKQISGDIFMYVNQPLKEQTNIYKGYQQHVSGKIPVAIKRILDCKDSNVREVENLVKVSDHPNIVRIIQSKETHGDVRILYIVMELCGMNLDEYMKENRKKKTPFSYKKTMSYSRQLVTGMKHIHENRIVHRDVKPENVLLSLNGEQIKITDFGLGKELRIGRSKTKASAQGQGTEGYRAPEALESDVISMPADIYSLGLTLFGLWSGGKHVYGDDTLLRDYNIKSNTGRDFSGLLISGIKRNEFLELVDQMLQFDPKLRPTIQEVAQDPFFTIEVPAVQEDRLEEGTPGSAQQELESHGSTEETIPKESASSTDEVGSLDNRTFFAPEEGASRCLKEHKYEEAITMLVDLQPSKRQQKMLAECYFRVGKDSKAVECINTLKAIMISSQDRPKPDDVIKSIEEFNDSSLSIQALILIPSAAELAKMDSTPDEALWLLVLCAWRCSEATSNLYQQGGRMRIVSKTIAIDFMHRILDDLQSITNANLDRKTDMGARCLNDIASAYYAIENYNKALEFFRKGIDSMKDHFDENAVQKYSVMQRLHLNLGASQYKLGSYREAEKYFVESLKVSEVAEDFPNEGERKRVQDYITAYLKRLRHKMKQVQNL